MQFLDKLKLKAASLKKEIITLYYAYRNPETGVLPRIIIILAIGYALSPIDLIPDFIPLLGLLDDIIVIPALVALSIRLLPRHIMDEARKEAETHPLVLKKKWYFGIIIIFIWAFVLFLLVRKIVITRHIS